MHITIITPAQIIVAKVESVRDRITTPSTPITPTARTPQTVYNANVTGPKCTQCGSTAPCAFQGPQQIAGVHPGMHVEMIVSEGVSNELR